MNWYLIPLSSDPQTFQISLAGVSYQMTVKWNDAVDAGWQFDLVNADTAENLVFGAPIITGADCLSGLEYLGINGSFIAYTNGMPSAVPTIDNLGTDCNLYFVTSAVNN